VKREQKQDLITAFQRLTDAAEEFVNRAPRVKRIQEQRAVLLDAIANAQLVLSVQRLPKDTRRESSRKSDHNSAEVKEQLKATQATLRELQQRLRPLGTDLSKVHDGAQRALATLQHVLRVSEPSSDTEAA
jgi:flagellar motility protein MotE (MotC chaperone)